MGFGQDASFSDEAVIDRYNNDLANDLGNTVSRVVTLSRRAFGGRTPPEACSDNALIAVPRQAAADYRTAMDDLPFQRAPESLWRLEGQAVHRDRKSTRLNPTHQILSYALFCLQKNNLTADSL